MEKKERKRRGRGAAAGLKKAASCWVARSPIQRFHEILWSVPVDCGALIGQRQLLEPSRQPEPSLRRDQKKKINWAFFQAAQGSDPSKPVFS